MKLKDLLKGKKPKQKLRTLYRIGERLRMEHNEKGDEFRAGTITEQEWKAYKVTYFDREKKVFNALDYEKDTLGFFAEDKQEECQVEYDAGKVDTSLDAGVDIVNIEQE